MHIQRRQFLLGTAALAAAGATGLRPAFADAVNLRQIFWGSQERANRTYKTNDLYKAANPGTDIASEFYAWNDYWPKLATETAGGNAPDIIQMDYRYIVEYAKRQAIAPLDAFVGKELDLHDFDQDQIDGGKVEGKLYGVSLGANSVAQIVNTAAFKEAGATVPDNNSTYDDLRAAGEAFKKANIRGGMKAYQDGSGVEPLLENWLRQKGKALYTADGKLGFDADDMVAWFKLWKDLRDEGLVVSPDDQALDTGPLAQTMVVLGKAAVTFANSNQLVAFQALMKDPVTITSFPRVGKDGKGGHYRKPSMFWSVANASKIQGEAAKYVSYFINNIDANKVLGVERGIPASASVRDAIAPLLSPQDQIALHFVSNLGDLLGPIPPPPPSNAGEIDIDLLLKKSQEVAFGQQSPEDAGP
ncbi:MAG TPA: ABC transporter substrate-binding protein, partial [Devosiaceae bacterium]|nr:ABC transporter substrate-binding protein [Devosiaceae bacterium]